MKEPYSRTKPVWQRMNQTERKAVMAYGEKYKTFLDTARTERLAVTEILRQAEEKGFKPVYSMKELKPGDKVYWNQKGKSVILAVIGEEPVHEGIKIVGSHIDSPRLDLKANPVREAEGVVYFRTHYYGGIKKYQWPTIPLALIGVIFKKDGTRVEINVGMKEEDPIFYISDLLIHMAQDQMKKPLAEGITGEQLQAIAWTNIEGKAKAKDVFMKFLKETYGIEEEDFATAELELVPATKSRDVGFDRSLIASYGQDDRVCSYANLAAILDAKPGVKTQAALLTDKEEIGSYGNTGMESSYFVKFVMKMLALQGQNTILDFYETMENSEMLSADVNSCLDPMFPEVSERWIWREPYEIWRFPRKRRKQRCQCGIPAENQGHFRRGRCVLADRGTGQSRSGRRWNHCLHDGRLGRRSGRLRHGHALHAFSLRPALQSRCL